MDNTIIRRETEADYPVVECLMRDAFWDLYVPGCDEHYLAHIIRGHEDFIPELDFVAEVNGEIIGSVMYTKSKLVDDSGEEKQILTFGPVAIRPGCQRRGYGKVLLEHSFQKAVELGYEVIVIFGSPDNYVGRGFKCCKKYHVCAEDGNYPSAMLVKELKPGALDGRSWIYHQSPAYNFDPSDAQQFDKLFEPRDKTVQPSQEVFYIQSHSVIQ